MKGRQFVIKTSESDNQRSVRQRKKLVMTLSELLKNIDID